MPTNPSKPPARTFFGLAIVDGNKVRHSDIEKLPFFEFWLESAIGSGMPIDGKTGETLVWLHDWENFCKLFITTGTHRFTVNPKSQ